MKLLKYNLSYLLFLLIVFAAGVGFSQVTKDSVLFVKIPGNVHLETDDDQILMSSVSKGFYQVSYTIIDTSKLDTALLKKELFSSFEQVQEAKIISVASELNNNLTSYNFTISYGSTVRYIKFILYKNILYTLYYNSLRSKPHVNYFQSKNFFTEYRIEMTKYPILIKQNVKPLLIFCRSILLNG